MPKLTSVLLSHWCYPIGVIEETNTKFLSYSKKRYSYTKISLNHLESSNFYLNLKWMNEFHDKLLLSWHWKKKYKVYFFFSAHFESAMCWSQLAIALIIFNAGISLVTGFECYTGDGDILRRKACPNFANICFKKMPGRK